MICRTMVIALICAGFPVSADEDAVKATSAPQGIRALFEDDFSGRRLDTGKWNAVLLGKGKAKTKKGRLTLSTSKQGHSGAAILGRDRIQIPRDAAESYLGFRFRIRCGSSTANDFRLGVTSTALNGWPWPGHLQIVLSKLNWAPGSDWVNIDDCTDFSLAWCDIAGLEIAFTDPVAIFQGHAADEFSEWQDVELYFEATKTKVLVNKKLKATLRGIDLRDTEWWPIFYVCNAGQSTKKVLELDDVVYGIVE